MRCCVTFERLHELLEYKDGRLYWRRRGGKAAGSLSQHGYLTTRVDGRLYYNHRIIWFMVNGYWPNIIDHINRDKLDNRLENLRDVSQHENTKNREIPVGVSGFRGVWPKKYRRCSAMINTPSGRKYLGTFGSPEAADKAYKEYEDSMLSL